MTDDDVGGESARCPIGLEHSHTICSYMSCWGCLAERRAERAATALSAAQERIAVLERNLAFYRQTPRSTPPTIAVGVFGLQIGGLYEGGNIRIRLFVEDDTFWHEKAQFSHLWLADLEAVVSRARALLTPDTERKG